VVKEGRTPEEQVSCHVRCYKCDKKGHLAKMCPNTETPNESHRVTTEESTDTNRKDATESKDNPVTVKNCGHELFQQTVVMKGVLLSVHQ